MVEPLPQALGQWSCQQDWRSTANALPQQVAMCITTQGDTLMGYTGRRHLARGL
jgi:hypothetical protein